ncbi:MAG TPA: hypothetical protein VMB50_10060 [Myxococcales bacterium]|nr:hypothetical protein [Myxococcales bacterium]
MVVRRMAALFLTVFSCSAATAAEVGPLELRLTPPAVRLAETAQDRLPSLVLDEALPPGCLRGALAGESLRALQDEAWAFASSLDPAPGGGGGAGPVAALAFVLGVIPGFGIGHLVAGSIVGFVSWLAVDVVVGVLLFWVFPVLLFPTFGPLWIIDVIVQVVERLIEGYAAFRTAEYHGGVAWNEPLPPAEGAPATVPARVAPNLAFVRF